MPNLVPFLLASLLTFATGLQNDTTGSWPSLQFTFLIKRMAARVHGQNKFSVLAKPIVTLGDTNRVLYDTFTSFEEGKTVFEYLLVDGAAYVHTSPSESGKSVIQCLNADLLPSVNSIVTALSSAKAVSSIVAADGSKYPCLRGDSFQVKVNGIAFGMCFSGSSGLTMFGEDMDIKVKYIKNKVAIPDQKLEESKSDCKKVASPSPVTSIGKYVLTGERISDEERILDGAFKLMLGSECTCSSTPRPCIFVHGLGVLEEQERNIPFFNDYWGDLSGHSPCCSSIQYTQLNTVNFSWTDHLLQQKVCDHVSAVSETSNGSTISDTIVLTHSMGGLMMAGAIANKRCKLASSTTWVSTGAPMFGSMASNYFQDSCKDNTNVVMEELAKATKRCPPDDGIKSLAYMNESYSNPSLDEQYKAAQRAFRKNVYAMMCSNSFSGVLSTYQARYWILGTMVPHKSLQSDGMVEYFSCAAGFSRRKFGNDYHDRFYLTQLNHHDMAFKGGDSLLDTSKMPVKWFECLL